MVIAREGRDLDPVFMALTEKITFDDASYAIHVTEWPAREIVLSKLGKQTDEFLDALRKRRAALADEAGTMLASERSVALLGLPRDPRGRLASRPAAHPAGSRLDLPRLRTGVPDHVAGELRPQG